MEWYQDRQRASVRLAGDAPDEHHAHGSRHATMLRMVGSNIAQLSQQVESIRTDEDVPRDVRDRLAPIDHELARIAQLTGDAADAPGAPFSAPAPRSSEDVAHAHRLAAHLTNREWQCLELLVGGLDTRAMADELNVSVTTVRTHVQSLLAKLGVNSRLQAVMLAIRTALVDSAH
jgi:DNA-binding NarL/FixJ family response regulator